MVHSDRYTCIIVSEAEKIRWETLQMSHAA